MNNAVKYRNLWLAKNSTAFTLWEDYKKDPKKQKALDQHLKDLDINAAELNARYAASCARP